MAANPLYDPSGADGSSGAPVQSTGMGGGSFNLPSYDPSTGGTTGSAYLGLAPDGGADLAQNLPSDGLSAQHNYLFTQMGMAASQDNSVTNMANLATSGVTPAMADQQAQEQARMQAAQQLALQTQGMSDEQFQGVLQHIQDLAAARPQVPIMQPPTPPNPYQSIAAGVAAALDPRHAFAIEATPFEEQIQERNQRYAQQQQQFSADQFANTQEISTLHGLAQMQGQWNDAAAQRANMDLIWGGRNAAGIQRAQISAGARQQVAQLRGTDTTFDTLMRGAGNPNSSADLRNFYANHLLTNPRYAAMMQGMDPDAIAALSQQTARENLESTGATKNTAAAGLDVAKTQTEDTLRSARLAALQSVPGMNNARANYLVEMEKQTAALTDPKVAAAWATVDHLDALTKNIPTLDQIALDRNGIAAFQAQGQDVRAGLQTLTSSAASLRNQNDTLQKLLGDSRIPDDQRSIYQQQILANGRQLAAYGKQYNDLASQLSGAASSVVSHAAAQLSTFGEAPKTVMEIPFFQQYKALAAQAQLSPNYNPGYAKQAFEAALKAFRAQGGGG